MTCHNLILTHFLEIETNPIGIPCFYNRAICEVRTSPDTTLHGDAIRTYDKSDRERCFVYDDIPLSVLGEDVGVHDDVHIAILGSESILCDSFVSTDGRRCEINVLSNQIHVG